MSRKTVLVTLLLVLLRAGSAFAWAFAFCGDSRDDADGIFPQILSAVQNSDSARRAPRSARRRGPGSPAKG